ncbi:hypothetical protein N7466_002995 [Penicillium verhagenii]|uniref:uncharacterized protein n=1 Tax=Penicillium verhagenii TaxID=1562060 RepID=UPI0025456A61|nr:uncharacterized protein N7466_002995 [Penicillium verhagenii]KAJ5936545.1 hypothetical protein N7466_002995 [Penicillium verhagenii]
MIKFIFKFTKEWLGAKEVNTYILPKIIFNPLLVLSLYIFLLGLLFVDCVFNYVKGEEILVSIS